MKAATHAAWLLLPGDRLADGALVVDCVGDGKGETVIVTTDQGEMVLARDELVAVNDR